LHSLSRTRRPSPAAEALWQFVAPVVLAQKVVFSPIGGRRFREHLPHLAFDDLQAAVGVKGRVGLDLGAVKGHHPNPDQAGRGAQPENLDEAVREGLFVRLPEPRDGAVVGGGVGGDHPEGDVLVAPALDPAARSLADAVGVEQERHHHLGLEGRGAPPVLPVPHIEGAKIHLLDGIQEEPGEVVLGQPLLEARGQQVGLVSVTGEEVAGHGIS